MTLRVSQRRLPHSLAGFTLIEILVTLAVISILLGLGVMVYSRSIKEARAAQTKAVLDRLGKALLHYRQTGGNKSFPIAAGGNADIFGDSAPGYYPMECAAEGSRSDGSESNRDLIGRLREEGFFKVEPHLLREGELVDIFGNLVIIRFLRQLRFQNDPEGPRDERVVIWTYGADGINQTAASSNYQYLGPNAFDLEEIERIEASSVEADDIRVWIK